MLETLLIAALVLLIAVLVLQIISMKRGVSIDLSPVGQMFESVERGQERGGKILREELATSRLEAATAAREARAELAETLRQVGQTTSTQLAALTASNEQKLEQARQTLEQNLRLLSEDSGRRIQAVRDEVALALKTFGEHMVKTIDALGGSQRMQLSNVSEQLVKLTDSNEKRLDALKGAVEEKLKSLQEDNAKSLEQMRQTVDEKLQGTLEKRLGESFKLVSERLEQVYKGLGEMQTLASGVGDLKRVLTNVKSRGTWGEVQLGALLEQVLTPDQYATNISTKDNNERVEFVIKLPNRGGDSEHLLLPIDAKFPVEDYQRLCDAQERADAEGAELAGKQLEIVMRKFAEGVCEKYVNPPRTTDFAILFLPTEGLYAEVLRRPGLIEYLQSQCKIVIAGPTTLWAILNSLQMGFRTLAIQKRSSEVWELLSEVKMEFGKYADVLAKVQKNLKQAHDTIEVEVRRRFRALESKLKDVEQAPGANGDGRPLLPLGDITATGVDPESADQIPN